MCINNQLLRELRQYFYEGVQLYNAQHHTGIIWTGPENPESYLTFTYGGIDGRVNWYYRNAEINYYGGNACVGIWVPGAIPNVDPFEIHPDHNDMILATLNTYDVDEAVAWAIERIHEGIGAIIG